MEPHQTHPRTAAIVAAAGGSTRMGVPKQRLLLDGVPVIARTLRAFEEAALVDAILLVAREEDRPDFEDLCRAYGVRKLAGIVLGGATRQESVAKGAAALDGDARYIAVHDGARPLIRPAVIDAVIAAAYTHGAAAAAVKAKDTVKTADADGFITGTPDRRFLWQVQTPQVFEREAYLRALADAQAAGLDFTDDCQLMERIGCRVRLIEADYGNIKITTPEDIALAQGILGQRSKEA